MIPGMCQVGWSLEGADEPVRRLAGWLEGGRVCLGADDLTATAFVARGETVLVQREDDRLLVSDGGRTARHLEGDDPAYRQLAEPVIAAICHAHGATLVPRAEQWPHITVDAGLCRDPAAAVSAIGAAVEAVFAAATVEPTSS